MAMRNDIYRNDYSRRDEQGDFGHGFRDENRGYESQDSGGWGLGGPSYRGQGRDDDLERQGWGGRGMDPREGRSGGRGMGSRYGRQDFGRGDWNDDRSMGGPSRGGYGPPSGYGNYGNYDRSMGGESMWPGRSFFGDRGGRSFAQESTGYGYGGGMGRSYGAGMMMGGDYGRNGRDFGHGDEHDERGPFERMGDRIKESWDRMVGKGPKGYTRSDERIREDVCDRLMQGWVNAENVEVSVKDGEVTLAGHVDHRHDKRSIEDISESVLGVKEIHNRLRVGSPSSDTQEGSRNNATSPRGGKVTHA